MSTSRTPVRHADAALSSPAPPAASQFGISSSYSNHQQLTQQPRYHPPLREPLTQGHGSSYPRTPLRFDGAMDGQALPTEPMPRQETGPWHPLITAQAFPVAPLPSRTQYNDTRSEVESGYSRHTPSDSNFDSRTSQTASGARPFYHGVSPRLSDVQRLDIQPEQFGLPSRKHPGSTHPRAQPQRTGRRLRSSTASSQWTCDTCGETGGLRSQFMYVPRLVTIESMIESNIV